MKLGHEQLANNARDVAKEEEDGAGYDIMSFVPDTKQEIYIKVKTSKSGINEPFYTMRN